MKTAIRQSHVNIMYAMCEYPQESPKSWECLCLLFWAGGLRSPTVQWRPVLRDPMDTSQLRPGPLGERRDTETEQKTGGMEIPGMKSSHHQKSSDDVRIKGF